MRRLDRAATPLLALVVLALSLLVWRLADERDVPPPDAAVPQVADDGYRAGTLPDPPASAEGSAGISGRDQRAAVQAAADAVVPALTFAPATLEEDLAEATSWMTDAFAEGYRAAFDARVRPQATTKDASATAVVLGAGVARDDQAAGSGRDGAVPVLLFVDQTITSQAGQTAGEARPAPTEGQLRLVLTMVRVDGDWRIDGLTAV